MIKNVSRKCPTAKIEGVLIVEMISQAGLEMIVGSLKDPSLGQTLMLGLGGIYVEIIKDVVFGLNPLSSTDVYKMIDSLKSKQILDGARGQVELDKEAVVECVLRFAQLLRDFPEIKEIDINPLMVLPKGQGVKILDARIII
jgi:4-hydroxybutyryl-CoA synthetase (ADP-forming)